MRKKLETIGAGLAVMLVITLSVCGAMNAGELARNGSTLLSWIAIMPMLLLSIASLFALSYIVGDLFFLFMGKRK